MHSSWEQCNFLALNPSKRWLNRCCSQLTNKLSSSSTLAGILRLIFLCITYPLGRYKYGYTAPAGEKTPLVLEVFNPTFWVMVEMCLGVWAANLLSLRPLLREWNIRFAFDRIWKRFLSNLGPNKSVFAVKKTTSQEGSSQGRNGFGYAGDSYDSFEMHPSQDRC